MSLSYADLIRSDVTLVSTLFSMKIHLPILSVNKVHPSLLQFSLFLGSSLLEEGSCGGNLMLQDSAWLSDNQWRNWDKGAKWCV